MNKRDFMLTACLLAAAGLLFIFFRGKPSGELSVVTARVDGKVVGSWQVDTDSEQEINTEYGHNRIKISGR